MKAPFHMGRSAGGEETIERQARECFSTHMYHTHHDFGVFLFIFHQREREKVGLFKKTKKLGRERDQRKKGTRGGGQNNT